MSKPPILLLHGMFSTPKLLSGWVSTLESAGYRVHTPVYPGHDPVDMVVLSRVTLSDYIAHALAAYDELDETPIVIGHSIGGLVAQHVAAARDPEGVGAAGAGTARCAVASAALVAPPVPDHAEPHQGPTGEAVGADVSCDPAIRTPRSRAAGAHRRFVPDSAHVFRSMSMGSRDTRVDPAAVRCPVLCVSGGADRNVATWISRRIARRYSAQEHHHPDLPHWIVANSALPQVAPPVLGWLEARITKSPTPQVGIREN